ncbi:MAG: hypothetical protein CMB21_04790, partial [Euryarchaeota archaeon]|nr:hypothetical protein [Euryarchaeota archaeon]
GGLGGGTAFIGGAGGGISSPGGGGIGGRGIPPEIGGGGAPDGRGGGGKLAASSVFLPWLMVCTHNVWVGNWS